MKLLKNSYLYYSLIFLIALALRLDFLIASDFRVDSDEAIVGLMAKHLIEGVALPVFYYGQSYMGSFEAWLVAFSYKIFGINNFAIKLVPLIFSLLFVAIIVKIAKELYGEKTARIAALLVAIPPSTLLIWSGKARGGFIELVCFGALSLLLTIGFLRKNKISYLTLISLGVLFGFSWWINYQIIYFIIPVGVFVFIKLINLKLGFLKTLACIVISKLSFLIGSLPFWLYNIENKFSSFEMFKSAKDKDLVSHAVGFFEYALPILLGGKRFWHDESLFCGSTAITLTLYVALFAYVLYLRRSSIKQLFKLQADKNVLTELVVFFTLFTFFVFIVSSFGYLFKAPRYLLPAYVGIFILTAFAISSIRNKFLSSSILVLILALNLMSSYLEQRAVPGEPFIYKQQRVSKDHTQLISWLDRNNYNFVKTNYWIGYRLALETEERIKFSIFSTPEQVRIESYEKLAAKYDKKRVPMVLVPEQAKKVKLALRKLGYEFSSIKLSDYVVIYNIEEIYNENVELSLDDVEISSNYNNEIVSNLIDNNINTRWGSSNPQVPSMEISLDFKTSLTANAFRVDLGQWIHDYARKLEVVAINSEDEEVVLLNNNEYEAIRYYVGDDILFPVYFPLANLKKISIRQTGSHPIFDWSMAEFKLYNVNKK